MSRDPRGNVFRPVRWGSGELALERITFMALSSFFKIDLLSKAVSCSVFTVDQGGDFAELDHNHEFVAISLMLYKFSVLLLQIQFRPCFF